MSSVLNPYDLPRYNHPHVSTEYFPRNYVNKSTTSSHHVARNFHGSARSSRNCGYGDHNPTPSYQNYKPEYPSRRISSPQHYNGFQNQNFVYQPPPGPIYPWL
ncbi:uncharacterized protein Dana_GF17334, isoform B [Drosophila ananassae]|nr:uncharacterized protein LOC6500119 isoform X2 [Drosophila ananassae]KPU79344.1 uncharacterized protein Dana_GF17334, isoform B [Drosophila ananassae]